MLPSRSVIQTFSDFCSNLVCFSDKSPYFIQNLPANDEQNKGWPYYVNVWSINIYWSRCAVLQLGYNKCWNYWSNYLFHIADVIYLHLFRLFLWGLYFWKIARFWSVIGLFLDNILVLFWSVFWLWWSLLIVDSTAFEQMIVIL